MQCVEPAKPLNDAQIGRSFYFMAKKKPYHKPYLSVDNLADLLSQRGLEIEEIYAKKYLHRIGYFRLSGYFYPLLRQPKTSHIFKQGATFVQAMNLYKFDRKLRLLLFSQIEKIEVAIRAQIVEKGIQETSNPKWMMEQEYFSDREHFNTTCLLIQKEWCNSKEDFVQHFRDTYSDKEPPAWILIELIPLGVLAHLFRNIRKKSLRKQIAKCFGVPPDVFASWIFSLSGIRNICCHHNRLWNRSLPNKPASLIKPNAPWIDNRGLDRSKTYYKIAMIKYLLAYINPNNQFKEALIVLKKEYPTVDFGATGFPNYWETAPLWK
ncbi:Abi family protein [Porphyromonas loveana]|uniref:Abi family protein n=1 Tax=Porphyromonas loveana TaxID=1884669 RepID=UPI00359FA350